MRIAFGLIWAIDAWFKWQPGFISSFTDQINKAKQDQPQGVQSWLSFWAHIVVSNPHFFAYLTAAVETALAVFLILGLLTHLTCIVGILWSLATWAIPAEDSLQLFLSPARRLPRRRHVHQATQLTRQRGVPLFAPGSTYSRG